MNDKLVDRELVGILLKQGKQHAEISKLIGCSPSSVAKVAGELGLQTRRNKQYVSLSDKEWSQLLSEVRAEEITITEANKKYGVSRSAIYAKLEVLSEND